MRLDHARACFAIALALSSAACGGAQAGGGTTAADGADGSGRPAWMQRADDPLAGRMREIAERMRSAGLAIGPIGGEGFLAMRETRTAAIDLPAGKCATIVALASDGVRDLDATLYLPSGDVLAEDVEPDAHPTVQVCAGEAMRRLYYHLQAYDGAGAFLYTSFVGERASFEAAARIVGGRPGVASDTTTQVEEDARVREFTEGVRRRGFQPIEAPAQLRLARDQRLRVPLAVQESHCYTVAAFAGQGVEDVDARVLDEEGAEVARDVSATADSTAQFCTEHEGDYAVELHAARGDGSVRVLFFEASSPGVGGSAGLWLGIRRETQAAARSLDEALADDLAAAQATGWGRPARRASGRLIPAEAVEHDLRLEARRCNLVTVTGGRGIGRLAMRVVDDRGALLAERRGGGSSVSARVCTEAARAARVQIIAQNGSGEYAVHTFTKPLPAAIPAQATEHDRGMLLDALEEETRAGFRLDGTIELVDLPERDPARVAVAVPQQGCARVHVVAHGNGGTIGAELRRGDRVASRQGGSHLAFRACRRNGGREEASVALRRQGGTAKAFVLRFVR